MAEPIKKKEEPKIEDIIDKELKERKQKDLNMGFKGMKAFLHAYDTMLKGDMANINKVSQEKFYKAQMDGADMHLGDELKSKYGISAAKLKSMDIHDKGELYKLIGHNALGTNMHAFKEGANLNVGDIAQIGSNQLDSNQKNRTISRLGVATDDQIKNVANKYLLPGLKHNQELQYGLIQENKQQFADTIHKVIKGEYTAERGASEYSLNKK